MTQHPNSEEICTWCTRENVAEMFITLLYRTGLSVGTASVSFTVETDLKLGDIDPAVRVDERTATLVVDCLR